MKSKFIEYINQYVKFLTIGEDDLGRPALIGDQYVLTNIKPNSLGNGVRLWIPDEVDKYINILAKKMGQDKPDITFKQFCDCDETK